MLTRYTPFERLSGFDRFPKMMEDMWGFSGTEKTAWYPAVDVLETDNELKFVVDLPGLTEKDVSVEIQDDRLTLKGERRFIKDEKKDNYIACERSYGSFMRQFRLDAPVNPNQIKAHFDHGVLNVTVPKIEVTAAKKIPITAK